MSKSVWWIHYGCSNDLNLAQLMHLTCTEDVSFTESPWVKWTHFESRGLTSVASDFILYHHKVKSCSAAVWICQVSNVFGWDLPNFATQEIYNEWLIIHSFSITASPVLRWARGQVSSDEGGAAPWISLQFIAGIHSQTNNDSPSHSLLQGLFDGGKMPDYPETTHAVTGRTCKFHTEWPQPSCCETSVLSMTLPH